MSFMLSVTYAVTYKPFMLSVIMLSVDMLNVVLLSVMAPLKHVKGRISATTLSTASLGTLQR